MVHHSRKPAILTLLLVLGLGAWPLLAKRASAGTDEELAKLQLEIAKPDAKATVWMQYGQKLESLKQHAKAALAYQRFLESDPFNKQARLQCANCLAMAGDRDDFFSFMQASVAADPKLALEVLSRPDVQGYLAESRFQALHRDAVAGSMD